MIAKKGVTLAVVFSNVQFLEPFLNLVDTPLSTFSGPPFLDINLYICSEK